MAFKMKGFPGINSKGYNNMKDGRSKSSAFQKKPVDKNWKVNQGLEEDLKSFRKDLKEAKTPGEKRNIGKDIHSVKNEIASNNRKNSTFKKDDIVKKNKQKQFNKNVGNLQEEWKNLKDRNSNKAKQLKKEASKIGLTFEQ